MFKKFDLPLYCEVILPGLVHLEGGRLTFIDCEFFMVNKIKQTLHVNSQTKSTHKNHEKKFLKILMVILKLNM